eukprot:tig00021043_g17631.t1
MVATPPRTPRAPRRARAIPSPAPGPRRSLRRRDRPRAAVVSGGCGEQAGPRGLRQQLIAASASGVGVPAGRGALRLMEVAALVLAAALKAGNERLSLTMAADKYARLFAHADAPAALALQLLHRHRVDSPLLAAQPTPPASPSSPSSACPPRPLVPRGA